MFGNFCLLKIQDKDKVIAFLIAIFAAILGINDLFASRYSEEEIYYINEKINHYSWYQAKGIKENIAASQVELLKTFKLSHEFDHVDNVKSIHDSMHYWESERLKYQKEKEEVLHGSEAVGEQNWIQEIYGELGQVTGALELDSKVRKLSNAGNCFDLAELLLQITMVLGAVAVLFQDDKTKGMFLYYMFSIGTLGSAFFVIAMVKIFSIM